MLSNTMSTKQHVNRLRVLRAERRMTQWALAKKCRTTQTRISAIENGLIEPDEAEQARLAKALGADVEAAFPAREAVAS